MGFEPLVVHCERLTDCISIIPTTNSITDLVMTDTLSQYVGSHLEVTSNEYATQKSSLHDVLLSVGDEGIQARDFGLSNGFKLNN